VMPICNARGARDMAKAKKPLVVVTRKLPDRVETRMRELFDARLNLDDRPMTQGELAEAAKSADVLVPTVTDRIHAALIAKAGDELELIPDFGTGVGHLDLEAAHGRGITVTNTRGVLPEETADMPMALILAVTRRLAEGFEVLEHGKWDVWSAAWILGSRI